MFLLYDARQNRAQTEPVALELTGTQLEEPGIKRAHSHSMLHNGKW